MHFILLRIKLFFKCHLHLGKELNSSKLTPLSVMFEGNKTVHPLQGTISTFES